MSSLLKIKESIFERIDQTFIRIDKGHLRRSISLKLIPKFKMRRGGKVSYAEWAYVIGIFHTLINDNSKENDHILDVGCGTGLVGIASYNTVMGGGKYTGLDVSKNDIEFCRKNFSDDRFEFLHHNTYNATYAHDQQNINIPWSLKDESFDLVTALSVWTHFNEEDAKYYINEVSRVLCNGGKAIITFFILDEHYESFQKNQHKVLLHNASSFDWSFNKPAYDSSDWLTTKWADTPEDAIAIKEDSLKNMLDNASLKISKYYPGTWKNYPGLYFQDILILTKKNG